MDTTAVAAATSTIATGLGSAASDAHAVGVPSTRVAVVVDASSRQRWLGGATACRCTSLQDARIGDSMPRSVYRRLHMSEFSSD